MRPSRSLAADCEHLHARRAREQQAQQPREIRLRLERHDAAAERRERARSIARMRADVEDEIARRRRIGRRARASRRCRSGMHVVDRERAQRARAAIEAAHAETARARVGRSRADVGSAATRPRRRGGRRRRTSGPRRDARSAALATPRSRLASAGSSSSVASAQPSISWRCSSRVLGAELPVRLLAARSVTGLLEHAQRDTVRVGPGRRAAEPFVVELMAVQPVAQQVVLGLRAARRPSGRRS